MKLSSYEVTQLCVLMLCHSASAYISVSISIYIYIYIYRVAQKNVPSL